MKKNNRRSSKHSGGAKVRTRNDRAGKRYSGNKAADGATEAADEAASADGSMDCFASLAMTGDEDSEGGIDSRPRGNDGLVDTLRPDGFTPGQFNQTTRHDGWTPQRKADFLRALANLGNVRVAASRVGMGHTSAYQQRRTDAAFAAGWDAALLLARDHAEDVLAERAIEGVEEIVYYHGEEVGSRRRFDARLLLAHLARLDRLSGNERAHRAAAQFDAVVEALAGGENIDALIAPPPPPPEPAAAGNVIDWLRAEHDAWVEADAEESEDEEMLRILQECYEDARSVGDPTDFDALMARLEAEIAREKAAMGLTDVPIEDISAALDEAERANDPGDWRNYMPGGPLAERAGVSAS